MIIVYHRRPYDFEGNLIYRDFFILSSKMMDKKELDIMELDNVSGGSWLDDLIDFGQDALKEIAPYIEEYQEYLPLPR